MTKKWLKEEWPLLVLFIINILIRLYRLGDLVPNIYVDEAAAGYSSWCLAHFGTDRYLNSWPLYIQNFYSGQSPAYIYLSAPIIYFLGLNEFSVRLLNAICYASVFPFVYEIIKRLTSEKLVSYIIMGIYTFAPFITIFSRIGLDCALLFPFTVVALYFMILAYEKEKTKYFIISSIFFALALYTYAISYIIIPLFLIGAFVIFYRSNKVTKKQAILTISTFIIISIPIIIAAFTMVFLNNEWNIGPFTFITTKNDRSKEFSLSYIPYNLKRMFILLLVYEKSIFSSTSFMNFFEISIPFFFVGMIKCFKISFNSIKNKNINCETLLTTLFLSGSFCFLIIENAYLYHMNVLIIVVLGFIGVGITAILKNHKKEILCIIGFIYIFSTLTFLDHYFIKKEWLIRYDTEVTLSEAPWDEVLNLIETKDEFKNKEVCFIGGGKNWIYTPFYLGGIDPNEVKDFDDKTLGGKCDYSYKNIHVNPDNVKTKDCLYAISNTYISWKYDHEQIEKIKKEYPNTIKLTYYTIYY